MKKAEAEMRRSEMKERRFIARNMSAGTAIGGLVAASRRAWPRTLELSRGAAPSSSSSSDIARFGTLLRAIIHTQNIAFRISPTARC